MKQWIKEALLRIGDTVALRIELWQFRNDPNQNVRRPDYTLRRCPTGERHLTLTYVNENGVVTVDAIGDAVALAQLVSQARDQVSS